MEELDEYYDFDNIIQRMLNKIPDDIDKREGSVIYNALAPFAIELTQMYLTLKYNIDLIFVDTSVDKYLNRLAEQIGMTRKQATKAIKKATFYDEDNELFDIEIGSRFTCESSYWKVVEKISTGMYKIECEIAGTHGNNISGTLVPIDYIQSLGKAILTDILIPGEDEETDEELRGRYFETINEKTFAGNIADYKKKTKEISGVGAVKVIPCWNGGGTVKLTILDSEFNKASDTLIENVQDIICPDSLNKGLGLAPIGHAVTVDTVEEKVINISVTITVTEGISKTAIKTNIQDEINKYLLELRKTWESENSVVVRISQIEARILNIDNVIDISNTKINNGTSNIELTSNQIPILGTLGVT